MLSSAGGGLGGWGSSECAQTRTWGLCLGVWCGSSPAWLFAAFSRGPWSWPIWLHCTRTRPSGPPLTHSTLSIFWRMDSLRKGNPSCLSQWVSFDEQEWGRAEFLPQPFPPLLSAILCFSWEVSRGSCLGWLHLTIVATDGDYSLPLFCFPEYWG